MAVREPSQNDDDKISTASEILGCVGEPVVFFVPHAPGHSKWYYSSPRCSPRLLSAFLCPRRPNTNHLPTQPDLQRINILGPSIQEETVVWQNWFRTCEPAPGAGGGEGVLKCPLGRPLTQTRCAVVLLRSKKARSRSSSFHSSTVRIDSPERNNDI